MGATIANDTILGFHGEDSALVTLTSLVFTTSATPNQQTRERMTCTPAHVSPSIRAPKTPANIGALPAMAAASPEK